MINLNTRIYKYCMINKLWYYVTFTNVLFKYLNLSFRIQILGAKVIVASRNVKKAEQAVTDIVENVKGDNLGQLVVEELDLASFASIKRCAKRILQKEKEIHLLVNNAGKFVQGNSFIRVQSNVWYCRHNGVPQK